MSRFIKVTSHPENRPLFLRWDFVELVSVDAKGATYVQLSRESHSQYALVSETPEVDHVAAGSERRRLLDQGRAMPGAVQPVRQRGAGDTGTADRDSHT